MFSFVHLSVEVVVSLGGGSSDSSESNRMSSASDESVEFDLTGDRGESVKTEKLDKR